MMYYDPHKPLEEIFKEVWDSGLAGGFVGGPMGVIAGGSNSSGGRAGAGTTQGQVGLSDGLAALDGRSEVEPMSGTEASQIAEAYGGVLEGGIQGAVRQPPPPKPTAETRDAMNRYADARRDSLERARELAKDLNQRLGQGAGKSTVTEDSVKADAAKEGAE